MFLSNSLIILIVIYLIGIANSTDIYFCKDADNFEASITEPITEKNYFSEKDIAALIQIDKDIDRHGFLNWHDANGGKEPGHFENWAGVKWSDTTLRRVIEIDISNRYLKGESDAFSRLVDLKKLNLSNNGISDIKSFALLHELSHLWLTNNKIARIEWEKGLDNLHVLALGDNNLTDLSGIQHAPNLLTLSLKNNNLKNIKYLSDLSLLQYLDLSYNLLKDLDEIQYLQKLETLDVSFNFVKNLNDINPNIINLYAINNQISDIAELNNLSKIRKLYLGHNQINKISDLKIIDQLEDLSLKNNRLCLSEMNSLMTIPNLELGIQYSVPFDNLQDEFARYAKYDFHKESRINDFATEFSVVSRDGSELTEGKDFTNQNGIITIYVSGEYSVRMRNKAVFSKGSLLQLYSEPLQLNRYGFLSNGKTQAVVYTEFFTIYNHNEN